MTECKGLFGKWFGHSYQNFLIQKPIFGPSFNTKVEGSTNTINAYYNSKLELYEIRCKRCGKRAE